MKKRKNLIKSNSNFKKKFWSGVIILILIIGAVLTGMNTSFYGVAIGVLLGYIISNITNNLKN